MSTPAAIILSPHLDDAVLSCWHLLDEGSGEVTVINVFAGSPHDNGAFPFWDRMTGATDSRERLAERIAEDAAALELAGHRPVNLGFLDEQYRTAAQPVEPLVDGLRDRVADAPLIYAPAAIGYMGSDHSLVREAALRLADEGAVEARLYADLPHALIYGWPSWVSGRPGQVDPAPLWEAALLDAGIAPQEAVPSVRELSPGGRARKLEAVLTYRTQSAALDLMFGGLTRPDRLAYEVTWELGGSR